MGRDLGIRSKAICDMCLFAVWELAVQAQGVQDDPRIPFPCPLFVKGCSKLPEGQTLVGMFAYRLTSRKHYVIKLVCPKKKAYMQTSYQVGPLYTS